VRSGTAFFRPKLSVVSRLIKARYRASTALLQGSSL